MPIQTRVPDPRNWTTYKTNRGKVRWFQRWLEAFWIISGRWSLHRAWQDGMDFGTTKEYTRTVIMGGR